MPPNDRARKLGGTFMQVCTPTLLTSDRALTAPSARAKMKNRSARRPRNHRIYRKEQRGKKDGLAVNTCGGKAGEKSGYRLKAAETSGAKENPGEDTMQ